MNHHPLLYGVLGLAGGILLTTYTASTAVNNNMTDMMRMMGIQYNQTPDKTLNAPDMGMGASMNDMMDSMGDKTADDFDQAFLKAMIVHHQGAIEMAREAQAKAKHPEIQTLAGEIIAAQTKEIEQMKTWQTQWGY